MAGYPAALHREPDDVGAGAQLVVVLHVVTDDAALVADVLDPLDEFVAAALELAGLGERRHAGEDEDRDAGAGDREQHGEPAAVVANSRSFEHTTLMLHRDVGALREDGI